MALYDRLLTDAIAHIIQAHVGISFTDSWLQGHPDLLFVPLNVTMQV